MRRLATTVLVAVSLGLASGTIAGATRTRRTTAVAAEVEKWRES